MMVIASSLSRLSLLMEIPTFPKSKTMMSLKTEFGESMRWIPYCLLLHSVRCSKVLNQF